MVEFSEQHRRILWVDDSIFDIQTYMGPFYLKGFELIVIDNLDSALDKVREYNGKIGLIILDVRMKPGKIITAEMSRGGFEAGITLGAMIKGEFPELPILGFSVSTEERVRRWFSDNGNGYLVKSPHLREIDLFSYAEAIIRKTYGVTRPARVFIVHGHDDKTKLELKNYLQNTLSFEEPIILHEQPNFGRTIIEKFEEESQNVDIAFILLTPDDLMVDSKNLNIEKRRARQNVIFELGYFYGVMNRRSSKVILCYKGPLELPSDISGIVYIDVTNGIESAGEKIRLELKEWLT